MLDGQINLVVERHRNGWKNQTMICLEVMGTNVDGEEGSDNDDHLHQDSEDLNGPDPNEVPNDIDDEGVEEGEDVHPLFGQEPES
ncbi:hypothetical protein J1N35_001835 [Gossypium stocksii]|uniref:Uncharacterized protein n=1 Tax=Gossypium stocksii TaxID=47602 RepID=A0A9D4ALP5_9ROSI|nr:hypothetical protein J1N35_001835 [Gossypium stocksii]